MNPSLTSQTAVPGLVGYLETSAARSPDRTAIVDPAGTSLTYRELNERAARIAGFLLASGVQRGDRVGFAVPKSAASAAIIFGILRAGAVYVPVDPTAPAARSRAIFADCGTRVLFIGDACAEIVTGGGTHSAVVRVGGGAGGFNGSQDETDFETVLAHPPVAPNPANCLPDDLAYILYTSGSTGVPKGVMLTHGNAMSFVDWCSSVFAPTEDDRFSSHAPFHFDLSVFDLYVAIKHGATSRRSA
jgi:non-ribosomal peptide synthetase component F